MLRGCSLSLSPRLRGIVRGFVLVTHDVCANRGDRGDRGDTASADEGPCCVQ